MSNFMGPMAPPPAAPAQPQALDFQTDPNQRQRFKQFMQQRMQPPMPQMPAPMPMAPMPQPMPTVPAGSYIFPDMDIFAPQPYADGGIVGGLNSLGEMSGQMVEALNQVVYGGDPMGGGMPPAPSGPPSMGGGGFGGGNMPPPLPPIDNSVYQPGGSTDSSGPVADLSNFGPDVGNGGLFSGGPEVDLMGNIAQPTLGGNVGGDFMGSAQNYFGNNIDPRGPVTPMTPEDIFRQAQMRNMQQDVKSPEVQAYLDNIIQTGGRPTMMAPKIDYSNLVSVLPGGGMITGKPGPGFGLKDEVGLIDPFRNPYSMPPGFTPLPPGELGFTENMMDQIVEMPRPEIMMGPIQGYAGGPNFDESAPYQFADGGSVSDALADALSNDIGDYAADDTMTDLAQTSWNDFDPGGNESYDAAAMDQFRNQQVSDLSSTIGQQIQNALTANQQMGTPAPVPQSRIEQMQFENLQNVPTTEPVFSMPSLNLGGKSTSFDLLGNPLTIGFEDGGSVPPRETSIRGQYHELSYITPDEADILMALGGSGEPGPMGIPQYGYGDDDGSEGYGDGDSDTGGMGSGSDPGPGNDDSSDSGRDGGWSDNDYRGYQEEDEQQQTRDMQDYEENVFGGDSPDGYSVQDILNDNAEKAAIERAMATTNAINTANQQRFNNLDQRLAETQLDPIGTLAKNEILDFESGSFIDDIETNSIGGVNTGVSKGVSSTNNLLGGVDDLLGSLDKAISKVSGPTQSEINALENARNQAGTFAPTSATASTPTVVGSSVPETYDPDLDQATKDALANIGVDQSVIDKISRGSSQSGLKSEGVLGALGIGPGAAYKGGVSSRFGTATGPGRLSTVTAEEMEKLRTGNAVQRQMYRQLAGIKSAGPVLSSFDPNNVEGNFLDTIANNLSKPSSAIEVFRAPITEQQGFKSVNTGTFKDGIAGVTGEGNMPGVMGGLMDMFGIDPIVYTGDNRFDPNRQDDMFGGGGNDNVLLPIDLEEVVPEPTDPNQIGGIGTPGSPIAAGPVLVPSNRTSTPFSGQMPVGYGTPQTGQINPYALSEMQRYQQMLARLGQAKSPIGLAEGGSVLDAAAGRFLESLTAA